MPSPASFLTLRRELDRLAYSRQAPIKDAELVRDLLEGFTRVLGHDHLGQVDSRLFTMRNLALLIESPLSPYASPAEGRERLRTLQRMPLQTVIQRQTNAGVALAKDLIAPPLTLRGVLQGPSRQASLSGTDRSEQTSAPTLAQALHGAGVSTRLMHLPMLATALTQTVSNPALLQRLSPLHQTELQEAVATALHHRPLIDPRFGTPLYLSEVAASSMDKSRRRAGWQRALDEIPALLGTGPHEIDLRTVTFEDMDYAVDNSPVLQASTRQRLMTYVDAIRIATPAAMGSIATDGRTVARFLRISAGGGIGKNGDDRLRELLHEQYGGGVYLEPMHSVNWITVAKDLRATTDIRTYVARLAVAIEEDDKTNGTMVKRREFEQFLDTGAIDEVVPNHLPSPRRTARKAEPRVNPGKALGLDLFG